MLSISWRRESIAVVRFVIILSVLQQLAGGQTVDVHPPPDTRAQPVEVPYQTAQQKAIQQPVPEYPTLARQAQVSGLVHLKLSIDANGRVANTELISGHPLLIADITNLISHWQYRPFLSANGQPAPVTTRIALRFDASKSTVVIAPPPAIEIPLGKEAPLSGTTEPYQATVAALESHFQRRKLPKYPDEPMARKQQGTVRFRVTVDHKGIVIDVIAVSGDPAFVAISQDAIKQWLFTPFLKNGSPVQVSGDVYLTFTLNPDAQIPIVPGDEIDALLDAAETTVRDRKVDATEAYCFNAIQRAQHSEQDRSEAVTNALEILYRLYTTAGSADESKHEDYARRWVKAATQYETPNGQWTARANADLGIYLMNHKRFAEAEQCYQKALPLLGQCVDPPGVRICTALQGDVAAYEALTLYSMAKLNESLPYFKQAVELPDGAIHPQVKAVSLIVYSQVLSQLGRTNEAQRLSKEATDYQNSHPGVLQPPSNH